MGGEGFDGGKRTPDISDQVASKVHNIVAGTITTTYVALALPGTAEATAKWCCRRVVYDSATGITRVTWAEKNGAANTRFVHVATDLTALTYS